MQASQTALTLGYLMKGPDNQEPRFHGDVDELRLYDVALTPAQVGRLATGTPDRAQCERPRGGDGLPSSTSRDARIEPTIG